MLSWATEGVFNHLEPSGNFEYKILWHSNFAFFPHNIYGFSLNRNKQELIPYAALTDMYL
jgi:hypothetical protein